MRGFLIAVVIFGLIGAGAHVWQDDAGFDSSSLGWLSWNASSDEAKSETARSPLDVLLDRKSDGSAQSSHGETDETGPSVRTDEPRVAAKPSKSIVYQWVDERGSVHFADSLDQVPPDWRGRAGQIELDSTALARATAPPAEKPRSAQRAVEVAAAKPIHDVTVYTAPWCGWCRKTLAFLDQRGVDYINKDIEEDERFREELREKTGGSAIPFVEIDDSQIHGFDPGTMASLLE